MTEYGIAAPGLRETAIRIAVAQSAIAFGVGSVQCIPVWRGLHFMRRSAEARDAGLERQGAADERRHDEVMKAFERQERESDRRHAEAMEAGERRERESLRRHEETMAALDAQRKGMETLIERTAPPPRE